MQVHFTHKLTGTEAGGEVLDIKLTNDLATSLAFLPFTINCNFNLPNCPPDAGPEDARTTPQPPRASSSTQTTPPPPPTIVSSPPPASLLQTHKVHQLDRIFTAPKFYTYLLSAPSTTAYVTADNDFLARLRGITEAEDCNADLVVEAYGAMNDLRRVMMVEVIKIVEGGLARDETERLNEWVKIEVPKIPDELMAL